MIAWSACNYRIYAYQILIALALIDLRSRCSFRRILLYRRSEIPSSFCFFFLAVIPIFWVKSIKSMLGFTWFWFWHFWAFFEYVFYAFAFIARGGQERNYNSEKQLNINFHGCSELNWLLLILLEVGPRPSYLYCVSLYLPLSLPLSLLLLLSFSFCVYN